jgi:hypothetical protein
MATGYLLSKQNQAKKATKKEIFSKIIELKPEVHVSLDQSYPEFHEALQKNFPGSVKMEDFMSSTFNILSTDHGFNDDNTMGMVAVCRDEITDPMINEVIKYWGKTFNCCSLAGFVFIGTTGLAAATAHTPSDKDGNRRFVMYAMPHIAISENGKLGVVIREFIEDPSHACGALDVIVKELNTGKLNLVTNIQDIEQSMVRQKVLSVLEYGKIPDLVEITKLAMDIIGNDVETLLNTLNHDVFKYGVVTGIQIHGPNDSTYIYPGRMFVKGPQMNQQIK